MAGDDEKVDKAAANRLKIAKAASEQAAQITASVAIRLTGEAEWQKTLEYTFQRMQTFAYDFMIGKQ